MALARMDAGPQRGYPQPRQNSEQFSAKTLTATHPIYDRWINRWLAYLDLYEGDNIGRYIHKHLRESTDSHNARQARVAYRNFCAPVVDLYVHYIFSKQITRTATAAAQQDPQAKQQGGGDAEWEDWLKNVDRQGLPVDRYMAEIGRFAFIFGHVFVAVDMPQFHAPPRSEAERKELGLRPYLVMYFPTEAPNWELDEDGSLLWIRFRELPTAQTEAFSLRTSAESKNPQLLADPTLARTNRGGGQSYNAQSLRTRPLTQARYRTWTQQAWYVHDVKGDVVTEVGSGRHDLGRVPVVPVYNRHLSRYPFIGQSLISDVAPLNIAILNLDSLIDESVYQSVINILVRGRQPTDEDEVVIGANNVMEYSGDKPPYFLTPSTAPLQYMEGRIEGLRNEIYRLAKLGGGLGLEPRPVPTATAAAFEFNETNRSLSERADELESGERKIQTLWHAWLSRPWKGIIDYPDDFSVQSFQEELQMVTVGGQAVRSPTFRRELEKRAAKKVMHNASDELLDKIEQEIDFIPEKTESFSGPVFWDPITQETKPPGSGAPVGALGAMMSDQEKQAQAEQQATINNPMAAAQMNQQADAAQANEGGKPPPGQKPGAPGQKPPAKKPTPPPRK